jgi:hypothetical protein
MSSKKMQSSGDSDTALVICTRGGGHLSVLMQSIRVYLPLEVPVYISGSFDKLFTHTTVSLPNVANNFGDAYNFAVRYALRSHDSVVIANDDIVLNPYCWDMLMQDVASLRRVENLGWVASRSDYARGWQNIRYQHEGDTNGTLTLASECEVFPAPVIAPIFAYIRKDAWIDFPPINWFSDDVQCFDMNEQGYQHYISRAYVHHVGSQSVGSDFEQCALDALDWCREHRPDFVDKWFGSPQ